MTVEAKQTRRKTPLRMLLSANAISNSGNKMALVAIPWFVLQTTGSATRTAIAGSFLFLPVVISGFFGGPIIDRLGFKRMSVLADIASGASVALIPLLHSTVGLAFWQLVPLVFLGALLDAPGGTARSSLIADTAELAGTRLERAVSAEDAIERGSGLIGAPVAGVLIGVVGASNVLWVDAATFLVSAVLVGLFVHARSHRDVSRDVPSYFSDLKEGLSYIHESRALLLVILTITVTNFVDGAIGSVVLPVYVNDRFGDAFSLGAILGVFGAGAFAGAIAYGAFGGRYSRRLIFVVGFVIVGLHPWMLAVFPPLVVVLIFMAIAGFAVGPINSIVGAVELERVPGRLRGRVLGASVATAWMALPLGVLAGGYLIDGIGLRSALIVLGGLYVGATGSLLFNPGARDLERGHVNQDADGNLPLDALD
ncbi:MAG: MFS transporter [Actinomycetota bacterium]